MHRGIDLGDSAVGVRRNDARSRELNNLRSIRLPSYLVGNIKRLRWMDVSAVSLVIHRESGIDVRKCAVPRQDVDGGQLLAAGATSQAQ